MPVYEHAYSLFRSNACRIQHNCTVLPIAMCKRSMSIKQTHKGRKQKAEAVDPSVLTLVRH